MLYSFKHISEIILKININTYTDIVIVIIGNILKFSNFNAI